MVLSYAGFCFERLGRNTLPRLKTGKRRLMSGSDTDGDSFGKPPCLVYFYYNLFVKRTQKD